MRKFFQYFYIPLLMGLCFLGVQYFSLDALGDVAVHPSAPSWQHWLGTTTIGQNVLAILCVSIMKTFVFLFVFVWCLFILSILIGVLFGYYARLMKWVPLERVIEIFNGIPLLMLLVILGYYQWLSWSVFLGLVLLFKWTYTAQISRGLCYEISQKPYVKQARILGFSDWAVLRFYLFPRVFKLLIPKIPVLAIALFNYITLLDFLGYSVIGEQSSLGGLIAEGRENLFAPWILLSGLFGVMLVLVPFIFMSYKAVHQKEIQQRGQDV